MAYRRISGRKAGRRSTARSTSYRRAPVKRGRTSSRRAGGRGTQTIRIVLEQPGVNPVSRPMIGVKEATPKKRAF